MNTTKLIITSITVLFLGGCEHSVDEPIKQNGNSISFSDISSTVFSVCLPCHSGGILNGGLDLSKRGNLIDTPSNGVPGFVYIRPAKPDSSYVYLKVINDPGITGTKMPPTGTLSDNDIATLREWIIDGAP